MDTPQQPTSRMQAAQGQPDGMPKKRPKVKGCYQCARRRIDCDGARPSCLKCGRKGIKCRRSGLNYRFCDGVAARGRLVGKKAADILSYAGTGTIPPPIDHIDAEIRGLLSYFSSDVVPIINVTSSGYDGYRELVLPASESDTLVRTATALAAREYIAARAGSASSAPRLCTRMTLALFNRSQRTPPEHDESAMTTLLIMQIIAAISGTADFRFSFGPLRAVAGSPRFFAGGPASDLAKFVKVQLTRIYLFGETVLDESLAVDFLAARQEEGFAFLSSHQGHEALRPSDAATGDIVTLIRMACDAYLLRATQDPPPSSTVPRVEAFINLVTAADAHTDRFGAHITAWACFIMAAESSTGEHRAFFRARFARLLAATGCLNIAKAMEQLEWLWATAPGVRWTSVIGGPAQALIM